jgi:ubiquinone/menaquinone biosynthesis C-methylase UbiE
MSGFDRIASVYDFLARLVFGNTIVTAQEYYLKEVKKGDRVLILGGGTGWILDSIFRVAQPGEIWYIDSSSKMIELARKRMPDSGSVHFIQGTEDKIPQGIIFDVVITNFFLDMFREEKLPELIDKILCCASSKCKWLCTDFDITRKWYHQMLLKIMYHFFKLAANLDNGNLPRWVDILSNNDWVMTKEKFYWNGFIKSVVFTKK